MEIKKKIAQMVNNGLHRHAKIRTQTECEWGCHRYEAPAELRRAPKEEMKK